MKVIIRTVKKLSHKRYGQTTFTKYGARIDIAEDRTNDSLTQFLLTLFHEMLHVWTAIAKAQGAAIDRRKEHAMIWNLEKAILREANKISTKRR